MRRSGTALRERGGLRTIPLGSCVLAAKGPNRERITPAILAAWQMVRVPSERRGQKAEEKEAWSRAEKLRTDL